MYALFFWVRRRTPSMQLNDFKLFTRGPIRPSNSVIRVAVCLGYWSVVSEMFVLAFVGGRWIIGVFAAFAVGELYCLGSDWLLAPPTSIAAEAERALWSPGGELFWCRLHRCN